ncbi:MAG: NTP transferase domain-containing protein [Oscillospiraceae bacterium]|jgi:bifunctional UDP-N-acetylglucosamine pyrophosphorylase/glucosamine-1-phosphate N-acetyltransferase|nr:NTP transferase domain-containing protein [Oscillospiraceae bacterium]
MDSLALALAAGEGQRMRSDIPKTLHPICGKPILCHVMDTVGCVCNQVVPILGHGKDQILARLGDIPHAVQDFSTGKGTGHAVMSAAHILKDKKGAVIVTAGDMPLVTELSYRSLAQCVREGAAAALLYDIVDDPFGYGRVIIDRRGRVTGVVEQKDLTEQQKGIRAANASVYCFDVDALLWALPQLTNHNAANEYYLTDAIGALARAGYTVTAVQAQDHDEVRGVNTRVQLEEAGRVLRSRINMEHMLSGVTMIDPRCTYVDADVKIGYDVTIYPGVALEGETTIGPRCTLYPGCHLRDAHIGSDCVLYGSLIENKIIPNGTTLRRS